MYELISQKEIVRINSIVNIASFAISKEVGNFYEWISHPYKEKIEKYILERRSSCLERI